MNFESVVIESVNWFTKAYGGHPLEKGMLYVYGDLTSSTKKVKFIPLSVLLENPGSELLMKNLSAYNPSKQIVVQLCIKLPNGEIADPFTVMNL